MKKKKREQRRHWLIQIRMDFERLTKGFGNGIANDKSDEEKRCYEEMFN